MEESNQDIGVKTKSKSPLSLEPELPNLSYPHQLNDLSVLICHPPLIVPRSDCLFRLLFVRIQSWILGKLLNKNVLYYYEITDF